MKLDKNRCGRPKRMVICFTINCTRCNWKNENIRKGGKILFAKAEWLGQCNFYSFWSRLPFLRLMLVTADFVIAPTAICSESPSAMRRLSYTVYVDVACFKSCNEIHLSLQYWDADALTSKASSILRLTVCCLSTSADWSWPLQRRKKVSRVKPGVCWDISSWTLPLISKSASYRKSREAPYIKQKNKWKCSFLYHYNRYINWTMSF